MQVAKSTMHTHSQGFCRILNIRDKRVSSSEILIEDVPVFLGLLMVKPPRFFHNSESRIKIFFLVVNTDVHDVQSAPNPPIRIRIYGIDQFQVLLYRVNVYPSRSPNNIPLLSFLYSK